MKLGLVKIALLCRRVTQSPSQLILEIFSQLTGLDKARAFRKTSLIEGYESSDLTAVVVSKTHNFIRDLAKEEPIILHSSQIKTFLGFVPLLGNKSLSVIDVGGGAGYHYFLLKFLLRNEIQLNWCIVETESMIKSAAGLEKDGLLFASNLEEAHSKLSNHCDLILLSSVLQYLPEPIKYLREMFMLNPPLIYISRTPFTEEKTFALMQESELGDNGPGPMPDGFRNSRIRYQAQILNRTFFEARVRESGFRIVARMAESDEVFSTTNSSIRTLGYIISRD